MATTISDRWRPPVPVDGDQGNRAVDERDLGDPRISRTSLLFPEEREWPNRDYRDVLRLSAAGLSKRQIAASLGIAPTAAGACLRRAREAGISWPLPDDLDDAALKRRLYPAPMAAAKDWRSLPRPARTAASMSPCDEQRITTVPWLVMASLQRARC